MCTGAEIGLILAAAGAGTSAVNNNVALRRQDAENARGIRKQGDLRRDASNRVDEQIADLAASTGANERADSLAGFQAALRASDESSVGGLPGDVTVGAANPRFAERVSQGASKVRTGAGERAGRMSRIDAPRFQRINEGDRFGRAVTDVQGVQRESAAEDFITKLRVAERGPNQFVDALAKMMSGVGSAMSLGAGGAATAGAETAATTGATIGTTGVGANVANPWWMKLPGP